MKTNGMRTLLSACALLALASACGQKPEAESATVAGAESAPVGSAPATSQDAIAAAIADPRRSETDRADDARRKPETLLAFAGVAPGMTVVDMEAGAGWYTEMLSYLVGADGDVIMQNPQGFRDFVGAEIDARLADGRLPNVKESYSNFDALDAADGSVDVVLWVQGPHELFYKPDGQSLGDPAGAYAEILRVLKPGGAFVAVDHSATEGAPETTGGDTHRIDKAIVLKMASDAGFVLDGESDFLANPADDRLKNVFDPAIRGHTDQFALRFKKPA